MSWIISGLYRLFYADNWLEFFLYSYRRPYPAFVVIWFITFVTQVKICTKVHGSLFVAKHNANDIFCSYNTFFLLQV